MKKLLIAAIAFLASFVAPMARAQTTTLTDTIIDPNGIPYASA